MSLSSPSSNDENHANHANRTIRFGIVGAGAIARRFAQSLQHVVGATLTHVWARRAEAAAGFCTDLGGSPVASFNALCASDLDAIYIATHNDSHAAYALAARAALGVRSAADGGAGAA